MLMESIESIVVTSATRPGWSTWFTTIVGISQVQLSSMPSSSLIMIRPPPREQAWTFLSRPFFPFT